MSNFDDIPDNWEEEYDKSSVPQQQTGCCYTYTDLYPAKSKKLVPSLKKLLKVKAMSWSNSDYQNWIRLHQARGGNIARDSHGGFECIDCKCDKIRL